MKGIDLVRRKEGHVHSSGLYEATSSGAIDMPDGCRLVICAYCHRWWWWPTGDVLRPGDGTCHEETKE